MSRKRKVGGTARARTAVAEAARERVAHDSGGEVVKAAESEDSDEDEGKAKAEEVKEEVEDSRQLFGQTLAAWRKQSRWRMGFAGKFKQEETIAVQELRTLILALRWLVRFRKNWGKKFLNQLEVAITFL